MSGPLTPQWKVFLKVFGGCSLVAAPIALFFPASRPLILLFLYTIPAHSVIPVPHKPAIVLAGKVYEPALVALVAGLASFVSSFLDYEPEARMPGGTRGDGTGFASTPAYRDVSSRGRSGAPLGCRGPGWAPA